MAGRSRSPRKAGPPQRRASKPRAKPVRGRASRAGTSNETSRKASPGKISPGKTSPVKISGSKASRSKASRKTEAPRSTARPGAVETALAAFAHEVRTPLTGILAVSELLATSDLAERERRWVETIKAGAEHLAGLATLFVDAARDGAAGPGGGLRQEPFDLRGLAAAAGNSLAGRAAAKGLQADVQISEALPAFAVGDAVRLRAALENLIDNAVKFTASGRVGLTAAPRRAGRGRIAVAFAVADSGIGLTLTEVRRLFRPFSQANMTIAARFGGAGLGLSSVRKIARAMGGDVVVAQRPGGGTVFTLTVILAPAGDSAAAMAGIAADDGAGPGRGRGRASGRGLRLLGVEDNPFGRVVLNAILTELGHHAEFVGRGEAAAERVAGGRFDAVLMDMVLPGIDGVETIRRIRALDGPGGRIAIIGVSGRGEDDAAARAAGADAFLLKPVSPRALATALAAAKRRAAAAT